MGVTYKIRNTLKLIILKSVVTFALLIVFTVLCIKWFSLIAICQVKRPGEENVKCTIMFLLDYQVRLLKMKVRLQGLKLTVILVN